MFTRLENNRIDINNISMQEIYNICLEIAYHSPNTRQLFNKGKLKKKYVKPISKLAKNFNKSVIMGEDVELDKLFAQFRKVLNRYLQLEPNISINIGENGTRRFAKIEETEKGRKVSNLLVLYGQAKQNTYAQIEANKQEEIYDKRQNEAREGLMQRLKTAQEREDEKTKEKNTHLAAEMYAEGVIRREAMATYRQKGPNNEER